MSGSEKNLEWQWLGSVPYREAWALQDDLRTKRIAGDITDQLLLLEHPPVITLGRKDCDEDIISPPEIVSASGIDVIKTNRGGRATYHGPGQLVGYAIVSIREFGMSVKAFVAAIEEICIRALSDFGVKATRDPEHPGLWVDNNKIVAVGLSVTRGITMHGFALNVDCDLAAYRHIVACGIGDRGVTSMENETGEAPPLEEVSGVVLKYAREVLGCTTTEVDSISDGL